MPLVSGAIGVDLDPVDEADRVVPDLAVVIPVVLALNRRPVEDARGVVERDAMASDVAAVLDWVPGEAHQLILT
jgi:hypothetical protein